MNLARALVTAVIVLTVPIVANATSNGLIHVRLQDRLDRPDDGYCFDILGTSRSLRVDLPLFAHNCNTAFGVNSTVLSGTPVLLRPCGERTAFFETSGLQSFDHTDNGQLKLRGSELCLAVGKESSTTYSPADRWRALSLESCKESELSHSAWELVPLT